MLQTLAVKQLEIKGRTRSEFGNLDSLVESIKKFGLIHPIVVEPLENDRFRLLAGERRSRACVLASIGDKIPYVTMEGLSGFERKEIELEENICREDLSWQEECELKRQLHELNQEKHGFAMSGNINQTPGWNLEDTATKLGESKANTLRDIQLAEYLAEHPEEKEAMKSLPKTTAFRKMKKQKEEEELSKNAHKFKRDDRFILCTAEVGMKALESDSIDLILTDPPYGTDAVGVNKTKSVDMVESDNLSAEQVVPVLEQFIKDAARVLKPGRHLYIFFALEYYNLIVKLLQDNNFNMNRYPIIWSKGVALTAGTGLNYTRSWEPIIFAYKKAQEPKDVRMLDKHMMDLIPCKPADKNKKTHTFEKPAELLELFIDQSSLKGEVILDPFAGSGSTIIAARKKQRSAIGFEPNENHFNRTQVRLGNGGK